MINILYLFATLIPIGLTSASTTPTPPPPDREYSWKDFNGTIPENAIIGGYDSDDNIFFVGQAYVSSFGNSIGPIYPGVTYIKVPDLDKNFIQINSSIKILCGQEPPVSWTRANAENLHVNLIGEQPVIGGKTNSGQYIHVGRIFYENEIQIGPVWAFHLNEALLYFVHKDTVYHTPMYEILTYELHERERKHRQRHFSRKPGRRHH